MDTVQLARSRRMIASVFAETYGYNCTKCHVQVMLRAFGSENAAVLSALPLRDRETLPHRYTSVRVPDADNTAFLASVLCKAPPHRFPAVSKPDRVSFRCSLSGFRCGDTPLRSPQATMSVSPKPGVADMRT
jgi:hypothetical protein